MTEKIMRFFQCHKCKELFTDSREVKPKQWVKFSELQNYCSCPKCGSFWVFRLRDC